MSDLGTRLLSLLESSPQIEVSERKPTAAEIELYREWYALAKEQYQHDQDRALMYGEFYK